MLPKSTAGAIRVLFPLHVAGGVAAALSVRQSAEGAIAGACFAIVVAQAGLLGILLALGTQSLSVRLLEALAGLLLPCSLLVYAFNDGAWIFCGLLATSAFVATGVLGLLRHRGLTLREVAAAGPAGCVEPLRFGIRHLMAWILISAVLVRAGQGLYHDDTLGFLFACGSAFASVSVAAPWAALGRRRPWLRSALIVLAAGLVGAAGAIYLLRFSLDASVWLASVLALEAVIVLGSLGTLRRCGLRLVRDDRPGSRSDILHSIEPVS